MTSTFVYNDMSRPLQISSVTPSLLQKLLKFSFSFFILVENEGSIHKLVNGNFDPPVEAGKTYEIVEDDEPKESIVATVGSTQVRTFQNPISAVENSIYNQSISLTSKVGVFIATAQASHLVNYIALIASHGPDPNLVNAEHPRESFKILLHPTSFRSCLNQLGGDMCTAFRNADSYMYKIDRILLDVPKFILYIFEILCQAHADETSREDLIMYFNLIAEASKKCKDHIKEILGGFEKTLKVTEEICEATILANTMNAQELEDNKKRKEVLKLKKQHQEKRVKDSGQEKDKAAKIAEEARQEFKEARHNNTATYQAMGLKVIEQTIGVGRAYVAPSTTSSTFASLAREAAPAVIQHTKSYFSGSENPGNEIMQIASAGVLQELLHTIGTSLRNVSNYPIDVIRDHIQKLRNFKESSLAGDQLSEELVSKAREVCLFLETNGEVLGEEDLQEIISEISTSTLLVTESAKRALDGRKKMASKNEKKCLDLCSQLLQAQMENAQLAQENSNNENERADRLLEEYHQQEDELFKLVIELQQIDLSSKDLGHCIKHLQNALKYLAQIKENWEVVYNFFDQINTIVEENLTTHMSIFLELAKRDCVKNPLFQAAAEIASYSFQLRHCASTYHAVSQEYTLPTINKLIGNFALTEQEAIMEQKKLLENHKTRDDNIRALVYRKQEEYNQNVQREARAFIQSLSQAVQPALQN